MEKKLHIMDSSGVHNLHGLPGLVSGVAGIIAAGVAGHTSADGFVNYENGCVCCTVTNCCLWCVPLPACTVCSQQGPLWQLMVTVV